MRSRTGALPGAACALVLAAFSLIPSLAHAQFAPRPPGPYVIDLRGSIIGVPNDPAFFPPVEKTIQVPARAFGFEVGAHVLPFSLGAARIGIGVAFMRGRGTVPDPGSTANATALAPQLSFNFGNRTGWSYLSVGYGNVRLRTRLSGVPASTEDEEDSDDNEEEDGESEPLPAMDVPSEIDSGSLATLNFGGGARWFLTERLAIGFDIRFHRIQAKPSARTPGATVLSTTAGISIR